MPEPLGYRTLVELLPPLDSGRGPRLDQIVQRVRRATAPELTDDWTALLLERI